ncbi:hypothetical protein [Hominifimenecus sp. rT4P-3]|uniref:hypothetical protein n=1 Tax=Hominifimenecus sp. rT4P-3 TaxID=3242979 RepID=UPI003DA29957
MKRYRGWVILLIFIALCASGVWLTLQVTAEYPTLGEPVSYPVNQIDGFELTIEKPSWSPFKGYTIRWAVTADSKEVYSLKTDFEYLERCIDGQWYRLEYLQDNFPFNNLEFALGGEESSGLEGSIVQKYAYYGTRLETGLYRVILEMESKDGTPHYLAAEFDVK